MTPPRKPSAILRAIGERIGRPEAPLWQCQDENGEPWPVLHTILYPNARPVKTTCGHKVWGATKVADAGGRAVCGLCEGYQRIVGGQRFGRLMALGRSVRVKRRTLWECLCDCGQVTKVDATSLRRGSIVSCGCLRKGRVATPKHPLYSTWKSMMDRCTDPSCVSWPNYGGRGIRMHPEWVESFAAFVFYIGPKPSPRQTIERIDNDGHYEPGNVRWATRAEQNRNTRRTRLITAFGETMCLTDWAARVGMSAMGLRYRLAHGWTIERALAPELWVTHTHAEVLAANARAIQLAESEGQ